MYIQVLIIFIMVIIKAIFSAADTAFTYINKIKISQLSKKDKKAKKIKIFIEDKNKVFSLIEIGIIFIELLASTYAAETFVTPIIKVLIKIPIPYEIAAIIAIVVIAIVLAYVLLVFGTILPKQIARNHPEKTAYRLINILWVVTKLNKPFEWLVRKSTRIFSAIFGISENPKEQLTEKEMKMIIREGLNQGIINKIEKEIILNTIRIDDLIIKKIVTPKEKVKFINIDDSKEKICEKINNYKYTRMPIYKGNEDNVIGIFNIKDMILEYTKSNNIDFDINKFIRKVILVDENQKALQVFKLMQINEQSMVVVINEKRKVIGIVTMEDIIEEIVGKIVDEYDEEDNN